ncbi:MAG: histidine kinase [Tabrizicola sp.]|nr:histidine kinase [Tabrizicola sp.]
MNVGRIAVGVIVLTAALGGAFLWYTAERAFYAPVAFQPGAEIRLVPLVSDQPEAIVVEGVEGIDASSSPIKFRACFTTPLSLAMLTETYRGYEGAEPLVAPSSFDCFDAEAIGRALETGEALAFLSEPEIHPGVDRVVAVFADGRAFAWHQLNDSYKD